MRGWSIAFVAAALFNLPIGLVFLLAPAAVPGLATVSATGLTAARMLGWCILAFAAGYLFVARAPVRNRDIVILSVPGKCGIVAITACAWLAHLLPTVLVVLVAGDLLWVAAFLAFLARTRGSAL